MQTIKSFKLLFIALVVCSNVYSQTNIYKPFPEVYGNWNVTGQHFPGPPNLVYHDYLAIGDTIIGAFSYNKVKVSTSIGNPFNFGPYVFAFGYRNDILNKKVYYLDPTGGINKDTLWYDFNLTIGDTIKETYSYTHNGFITNNQRRIVSSIDSVLICGMYHKQFNFGCPISSGFQTSLIEGVGFKDKFDTTGFLGDCPFEPSIVYTSQYSNCNINALADLSSNHFIKIFPNPTFSELKINALLQLIEYSIVNNIGEIVLKGNFSATQSIDVSSIANGIYSIKMQDKLKNSYQSKFIKQ